jgi:hypothetical protein
MKVSAPALVVLIAASASAQRQQPSNASEVQDYSLQADNLIEALLKISAHFQIPMGVEWVKSADTLKPVQIFRGYTNVKDIVDGVVFNYVGYECRMEDGAVHVFRRDLVSDNRNPLNVTIDSFEVKNTVTWANVILFNKIQHVVRTPDSQGIAGSVGSSPDDPVFNFTAQNVPARFILNKVVTAGLNAPVKPAKAAEPFETVRPAMRVWITTFPDTPTFSRTGYLEAAPMEDPKFVADDGQPFWNLLAWGEPPPEKMVR